MADEEKDSDLGGDWARDAHRGGFGDDYARDKDEQPVEEKPNDDIKIGKASESKLRPTATST